MHAWWRVGWLAGCATMVSCGGQSVSHRSDSSGSGGSAATSSGGTGASGGSGGSTAPSSGGTTVSNGSGGSGTRSSDESWVVQPGESTDDEAYAVGVDADDHVYVLRVRDRIGGGQSSLLDKYEPSGTRIWSEEVSERTPARLAVWSNGTSVIAGASTETDASARSTKVVVTARDRNGKQLWTSELDGQGPTAVLAINADSTEHTFVLWARISDTEADDNLLSELDENGNELVRVLTSDPGPVYVSALDPTGNLLEAGGATDHFFREHDPQGNERWRTPIDANPAGLYGDDQASAFVVGLLPNGRGRLTRVDQLGGHIFDVDLENEFEFTSLVVGDVLGRSYTAGIVTTDQSATWGVQVRRFEADGTALGAWPLATGERDQPMAVAVDSTGALLLVGYTQGSFPGLRNAGGTDSFIARIVP